MSKVTRVAVLPMIVMLLARCGRADVGAAQSGSPLRPIATVDQVMDAIVVPSSQAVFDAVVYVNGELVQSPKTDDDWFQLQMRALAVAEAANLLMMPPRARDAGEWITLSQNMNAMASRVAQAAEARDIDLLLKTGGELYTTCTGCHRQYVMAQ